MMDQNGGRIVGMWQKGRLSEELIEAIVPALEVDCIAGPEKEQRVFVSTKEPSAPRRSLVDSGLTGKALVVMQNGDKYIGGLLDGHKEGPGMYVYANGTAYKVNWKYDVLDEKSHPVDPSAESEEVKRLHDQREERRGSGQVEGNGRRR